MHHTSERTVVAGGDEIGESLRPETAELRQVQLDGSSGGVKTVVEAVGEGGEGEAGDGGGFVHTTEHVDGGEESDVMEAHASECFGELEGGVDVALCRECH